MNRFDEAIELVDRLIRLDQLSETAHRAAIRLEYRRGRPQAALARYDVCRTALHRELELEPLEETRALAQEIEQHLTATRTSRPSGRGTGRVKTLPELSLPQPATTFVGRESELAAIEALLKESGCRFVTLVGAGGAGKTRLALQAASRLSRSYADGAHFVALASLSTPTAIASAFAEGLGFRFAEQGGPQAQLIDHLRDKELLVVVDNLEQLVEGAGWLVELVEACTTVTLLVTSREALGVAIEERHVVTGMDYPTLPDDEALERYDAVQLFVQAARRADSRFALTAETEQGVRRIVQLTEGLPLALELAAAWLARLTVG